MSRGLGLAVVLGAVLLATLGEGGASPRGLLVLHLWLAAGASMIVLAASPSRFAISPRPLGAFLIFAALAVAGAFRAPYAYAAWLVLVEILAFGVTVWMACGAWDGLERYLPPAVGLLAAGHGLAAIALRLSGAARPASTFLNPNHLGAWLTGAALFLAGTLTARPARARGLAAALIVALGGVAVTGSRGALVGLALGAGGLIAVTLSQLPRRKQVALLAACAAVVLVVGLGAAWRFRSDDDPYRFHRTRIWRASLGAVTRSPWLGVGPGQFAAAAPNLNFALEDSPLRFERAFLTPHSDVLRAVCEFGLPAGFAAYAAIALCGIEAWRRRAALSPAERGAFAALCGLFGQSCVDDLTTRPALTILMAAMFGLLVARGRTLASRTATVPAWAIALLLLLALGAGEIAGYLAWEDLHGLPPGRLDDVQLSRLRRSIRWNPMQPAAWQRLAQHDAADVRSLSLADYAAAREAVEHARRLQPADAYFARAAARTEAAGCLSILPFTATRNRAAALYDEAGRLARTDATVPLEAARFLLLAGDPEGARREATRALEIEPKAVTPRVCLAEADLREGGPERKADARRVLDEAVSMMPPPEFVPTSAYDAALRIPDPARIAALRKEIAEGAP